MQLAAAISDLDAAAIDRKIISEEAQSIQEEYQSTNEELLTSKEELQSLNEELTALNTQLQETLEQQRSASSDLQNVLYSTNIATLFLDRKLQIRFYTPATTALFRLLPSDIGRPLADLKSLATDPTLLDDSSQVLETLTPAEHFFEAADAKWFRRRIFPYVGADGGVSGVVITFSDFTDQHAAAAALDLARREAERANAAKSRFLAAASHDLRQPLQTLSLLQGLLAKAVTGDGPARLIARFDETLSAMSGMLNTLLDINQIEAGEVRPIRSDLAIGPVLQLIKDEFTYHALAKRLTLRVVPSRALVNTDSRLLEQILRNLVSNALKYTPEGKVLVGCRRRGDHLRIEVWDTGVGIPTADQARIFEEYQQLDNEARERSKGIGLGLAIVKQLAGLLGHKVTVGSVPGAGSLFAIELPLIRPQVSDRATGTVSSVPDPASLAGRAGAILVVEDDPELRALLVEVLSVDGHRVLAAASGPEALAAVQRDRFRADVMLIDYNLPGGLDGIETSRQLNLVAGQAAAVIVLTGDISTRARLAIDSGGAVRLSKPIKTDLLRETLRHVLAAGSRPRPLPATVTDSGEPVVYLVDDDAPLRQTLRDVLEAEGRRVEDFPSCEAFLQRPGTHRGGCLLLDAYLPGMSGLELLRQLSGSGYTLPTIVMTGRSDIATAVNAMKAGAIDFIQKPVSRDDLVAVIARALEQARDTSRASEWRDDAIRHIHALTPRQREVMDLVLAGHPSKNIAADLGISQRTVENHRASIMKRTGTRSLPALARLAVAAALSSDAPTPA
jgi:two-component system CheB/CheR fusion protein